MEADFSGVAQTSPSSSLFVSCFIPLGLALQIAPRTPRRAPRALAVYKCTVEVCLAPPPNKESFSLIDIRSMRLDAR